jgi:hypothetical protein
VERPSLFDAFNKLGRARQHLSELGPEILDTEANHPYRISVEVDAQAGEYIFHVDHVGQPPYTWGLMIGDCLHNARTALDYLMVRIVALITGDRPRDIETVNFPVETDPAAFASKVGGLRKQNPVFSGYLTRMEELQPYNQGNPSIWGTDPKTGGPLVHSLPMALQRLTTLDNIDKHRVVHAVWLGVSFFRGWPNPGVETLFPPEFKFEGATVNRDPLEDGAEVGRLRFETPLPSNWEPDEVDVKREFPLQVAFDEPPAPILNVLEFCLWGVESVLELFSPVFAEGKPPSPVTTVEDLPFPPT